MTEARHEELHLVRRALGQSIHVLMHDPEQLAGQLAGRLSEGETLGTDRLLGQSRSRRGPQLLPRQPTLADAVQERVLAGHRNDVVSVSVAPDTRRVISASADRTLRVWDLHSGREEMSLSNIRPHPFAAAAVAPLGDLVVSVDIAGSARVWDIVRGAASALLWERGEQRPLAFVPHDDRLLSVAKDGTSLHIWDLRSGDEIASIPCVDVAAASVSPCGKWAVTIGQSGVLRVWDLEAGMQLAQLRGHTGGVTCAAITPDGRHIISGSDDGSVKLWDLAARVEVATLTGHNSAVRSMAISDDGRLAASVDREGELRAWELTTRLSREESRQPVVFDAYRRGEFAVTDTGRIGHRSVFALHPTGRYVVTVDYDRIFMSTVTSSAETVTLGRHDGKVEALAFTADGGRLISSGSDYVLRVWDLEASRAPHAAGHAAAVSALVVTPMGHRVVSGSDDSTLTVWQPTTGLEEKALLGHEGAVRAVIITGDARRVVSGSSDATIRVWSLKSGEQLRTLDSSHGGVAALAVAPDGQRAVSGSTEGVLECWDLEAGEREAALAGHASAVTAVAITACGRYAVSASYDRTLRVWDLRSGSLRSTLVGHYQAVRALALSPDGNRVVSVSDDRTVRVWDLGSGTELMQLVGHWQSVTDVNVYEYGRRAITVASDRTARIWDIQTGRALQCLEAPTWARGRDRVRLAGSPIGNWAQVAVGPRECRAVTFVTDDPTLRLWDLATGTLLASLTFGGRLSGCAIGAQDDLIVAGDTAGRVHTLHLSGVAS